MRRPSPDPRLHGSSCLRGRGARSPRLRPAHSDFRPLGPGVGAARCSPLSPQALSPGSVPETQVLPQGERAESARSPARRRCGIRDSWDGVMLRRRAEFPLTPSLGSSSCASRRMPFWMRCSVPGRGGREECLGAGRTSPPPGPAARCSRCWEYGSARSPASGKDGRQPVAAGAHALLQADARLTRPHRKLNALSHIGQQIRGSCSPLSMLTTRDAPMAVVIVTRPPSRAARTRPMVRASWPSGVPRRISSARSAS